MDNETFHDATAETVKALADPTVAAKVAAVRAEMDQEDILTPAMRKQFADSFAYAKARYGSLSAAYKEAGGYAGGASHPPTAD